MINEIWNLSHGETVDVKLIADGYKYPVTFRCHKDRLILEFGYRPALLDEIKQSLEGRKWHGFPDADAPQGKWWSIPKTPHNKFQLSYMLGDNPYSDYDAPLCDFESRYPLYAHQNELAAHVLTRRHCILAAEMGTGKTLTVIAAIEHFIPKDWTYLDPEWKIWYIAPKSALRSVERDFNKWNPRFRPEFMTYDGMKKRVETWVDGTLAPRVVVFDESSRLKNYKSQRSKCAQALADGMRNDWGRDCLIVEMSGSPAPKAPTDWYSQCKIACPGFLKEGRYYEFEHRLALIVQQESIDGVTYPKRVAWKDTDKICATCGMPKEHLNHDIMKNHNPHAFKAGDNEVARLYRRMSGLVIVKFKKDCLDLPEKQYEVIYVQPTKETLRLARLVQASSTTAIECLTKLRTLSDGFQYQDIESGVQDCPNCKGSCKEKIWYDPENEDSSLEPEAEVILESEDIQQAFEHWTTHYDENDEEFYVIDGKEVRNLDELKAAIAEKAHRLSQRYKQKEVDCGNCGGQGKVVVYRRDAVAVTSPKIEALVDELNAHEEIGRIVIFAGFTGSVDRVVDECQKQGWYTIRVDGRGWQICDGAGNVITDIDPLTMFQDKLDEYPNVAFVGQPGAAGMGLTLTASPTIIYYSNDFNAESRIQSEDRIHRVGMDVNRGATIKDIIHLPSDQLVLDNLKAKRRLQSITMGEMEEMIKNAERD